MHDPPTLSTRLGDLPLRRAAAADAGAVFDIMCDAALWLASRGINQWRTVPTDGFRKFLDQRVAAWPVYLLDYQGKPVATICLQDTDEVVWGDGAQHPPAGYIHGLATRSKVHGQGVGRALLDFAEQRFRQQGRQVVRLDCAPDNAGLCQYYRDCGYVDVRVHTTKYGPTRLFEKPL